MPTVEEVAEQIKFLMEHGRGQEKAVLVLPGLANRRKMKSRPKRFSIGGDEAFILRLLAQKERYMSTLNKTIALEILCSLWEAPTQEQLERWQKGGQDDQKG
jgi:hypothetical protein